MSIAQTQKTHCPRGHWLGGANLSPVHLKAGRRSCLVCGRAFTAVVNLELRGHVFDDREAAVRHFADLELQRTDKGRDAVARDAQRTGAGVAL